jgi:hypothetical protein
MTPNDTEVLSALVDGEAIDPSALATVLETAEARAILVDFVRLRNAARMDAPPLPQGLGQLRVPRTNRHGWQWAAVAAALVIMFIAGLLTPVSWRDETSDDAPPEPTRIEQFVPGVDWRQGD